MIELVIDGSFENINLSIFEDKGLVYDLLLFTNQTHSKILVDVIDSSLQQLSINLSDIDNLYCVIGPGRYTSLRVVLSTLKGIFFERLEYIFAINRLDLISTTVKHHQHFRVISQTSPSKYYFMDYDIVADNSKRTSNLQESTKDNVFNTALPVISEIEGSLTKYLFRLDERYIKKIKLMELIPIY